MEWAHFYRNKLNPVAQKYYDSIMHQLREKGYTTNGVFRICIEGQDPKKAKSDGADALLAVLDDNPQLFFFDFEFTTNFVLGVLIITCKPLYSATQCCRIKRLLDKELELLTNGCRTALMGDFEKELTIYSRVASRYSYSKGVDPRSNGEGFEPIDYTVVGPVLKRTCVCSGYAAILILALREVGIPCFKVRGGGHAWVMVSINGIPLHCDATWESVNADGTVSYEYFNLTEQDILKDHRIEVTDIPESRFKGYSYHNYNKCSFSSPKDASAYIRREFKQGNRTVRVRLDDESDIEMCIRNALRACHSATYTYYCNKKLNSAFICAK